MPRFAPDRSTPTSSRRAVREIAREHTSARPGRHHRAWLLAKAPYLVPIPCTLHFLPPGGEHRGRPDWTSPAAEIARLDALPVPASAKCRLGYNLSYYGVTPSPAGSGRPDQKNGIIDPSFTAPCSESVG